MHLALSCYLKLSVLHFHVTPIIQALLRGVPAGPAANHLQVRDGRGEEQLDGRPSHAQHQGQSDPFF